MIHKIKQRFLRFLTSIFEGITISTVNSVCWYNFGQEKEPESLKRLKKH